MSSMRNAMLNAAFSMALLVQACGEARFKTDTKSSSRAQDLNSDSGEATDPKKKGVQTNDGGSGQKDPPGPTVDTNTKQDPEYTITFEPVMIQQSSASSVRLPLAIYFALDVTFSMNQPISTIKTNIAQFAQILKDKNYDPSFGLVAFKDVIHSTQSLTKDVTVFKNFVSTLVAEGGNGDNEASLMGVKESLQRMATEAPAGAVKLVVVITDNPGHYGNQDGPNSNCSIADLQAQLSGLSADQQKLTRVFHSTGLMFNGVTYPQSKCGGYVTAEAQWNDLLSKSLPSLPLTDRGGKLAFPFTGTILNNDFTAMIEKTIPMRDVACISKSAKMSYEGAVIGSWQEADLAKTYLAYKNNEKLAWAKAFSRDRYNNFDTSKAKMDVELCCILPEYAESGDFSKCEMQTKTVGFVVK